MTIVQAGAEDKGAMARKLGYRVQTDKMPTGRGRTYQILKLGGRDSAFAAQVMAGVRSLRQTLVAGGVAAAGAVDVEAMLADMASPPRRDDLPPLPTLTRLGRTWVAGQAASKDQPLPDDVVGAFAERASPCHVC